MTAWQLVAAVAVDLLVGDPRWLPHPVKAMGWVIARAEQVVRRMARSPRALRVAGIGLAAGLPVACYLVGWAVIVLTSRWHPVAGTVVTIYLATTTLAIKDLVGHARAVHVALEEKDVERARQAVSKIVGRETAVLPEREIVRGTVETLAESSSDGIVAPLCYLVLGGPPLALAYKAVSTLDSMIGHRSEAYRHFGWASARLDDAANWIPARLTGVLIVAAAYLQGYHGRNAWRILVRDGAKHPSPNSGRPEAAMAGALRVQLGGTNVYGGVVSERPRLGDPGEPLAPDHIPMALDMVWTASGLAVAVALLIVGLSSMGTS
jgi:adenosylcobinamide-phosphate synthase